MKKEYLFFMTFFLAISVSLAQNVDSFTVSNPNPKVCDTVQLINRSTNYISQRWMISGGQFEAISGYPYSVNPRIVIKDTGCYSVTLINIRLTDSDTIRTACAFHASFTPLIEVVGNTFDTIPIFTKYIDPGYNILRNCIDTDTVYVEGTVNNEKTGINVIKYHIRLKNEWTDFAERIVYVADRNDTMVVRLIKAVDTLEIYHTYPKPDFFVYDNNCSPGSMILHSDVNIDTARLGVYNAKYWAENCMGNFSDTLTQTVYVLDRTPPVLKWKENIVITIGWYTTLKFDPFDRLEVSDNYDTNVTVTVGGTYFTDYLPNTGNIGIYTIIFEASDSSGNTSNLTVIIHVIPISIPEDVNSFFKLYPNPSNGQFTLELGEAQIADYIRIFDVSGKLIMQIDQPQQKNEIQMPGHCKGLYIVQVGTEKGIYNTRIFVN